MPHTSTQGFSDISRCVQCHVYRRTDELFIESDFVAYRGEDAPPHRAYAGAPAVMPHRVFMRESCLSCHSGPAAREEIRTSHPERTNCTQCHVPVRSGSAFAR
jgi:cytochrome c-type protein NapB